MAWPCAVIVSVLLLLVAPIVLRTACRLTCSTGVSHAILVIRLGEHTHTTFSMSTSSKADGPALQNACHTQPYW